MLTYLRVRNLAVLRDVEIEFGPGLNVLTGETGAGKSLLVDAVGLLLGQRADGLSIRHGEERAVVEGQFAAAAGVAELLHAEDLEGEDDAWVVRREIFLAAPNRVFINGHLSTLATLRRLAAAQVSLHGQSRHLVLATPEAQRRFLDGVALPPEARAELAAAWQALGAARAAHRRHLERLAAGRERLDLMRFQLQEITGVAPRPGEDDALRREERLLATVEERRSLGASLRQDLLDGDEAVVPQLAGVRRRMEALARLDPGMEPLVDRLAGAALEIEDLAREVVAVPPAEEDGEGRLEEVQLRLQALQGLCRKHGGTLDQVLATAARLEREVGEMDDGEATAERLRGEESARARAYHTLARRAGRARRAAAAALGRRASDEMQALNLAGARLDIQVTGRAPAGGEDAEAVHGAGGPGGYDRVVFKFTAHADEPPRDLARVASGGELSRLMLALTLAAQGEGEEAGVRTFIFDEVDAGIGGDAAAAVGERLRRAASRQQVICVTHLPQVAALASHHLLVAKSLNHGRAGSRIRPLPHGERVAELARMLGGGTAAESARRHARSLLAAAAPAGGPRRGAPRTAGRSSRWA